MTRRFAWFLLLAATGFAMPVQGAFNGRDIFRAPDMANMDRVDTVSWYSEESVRLAVEPWRAGRRMAIPEGATAAWVVCDEGGTNWIVRYDSTPTTNCTFWLGSGEGALPAGHDYAGYVSLLDGTNILGVVDRHNVRVLGQAADGGSEISPEGGAWGGILQRMAAAEAAIATNAAAIAALEADVSSATNALLDGVLASSNTVYITTNVTQTTVVTGAVTSVNGMTGDVVVAGGGGGCDTSACVAKTNGAWVVVQEDRRTALELNGVELLAAIAETEVNQPVITGIDMADKDEMVLTFFGGESNRLEATSDHIVWETWDDCTWSYAGGKGTVDIVGADEAYWYRIVADGDTAARTNAYLLATAPLYIQQRDGDHQVATVGMLRNAVDDRTRRSAGYLPRTGYADAENPYPTNVAWSIGVDGAEFRSITLGGEKRTNWPSGGGGSAWQPTSRVITSPTYTVAVDDCLVWLDSEAAQTNQVVTLPDLAVAGQIVTIRHLGGDYPATIQRGTATYTLQGDGAALTCDWLAAKTNWYWRTAW